MNSDPLFASKPTNLWVALLLFIGFVVIVLWLAQPVENIYDPNAGPRDDDNLAYWR